MTLTLELAPEIEQALEETARANGKSAADYATTLLDYAVRVAKPDTTNTMQRAEIAVRLAAWGSFGTAGPDERAAAGLGPLPDEAFDRESIYEGCGE